MSIEFYLKSSSSSELGTAPGVTAALFAGAMMFHFLDHGLSAAPETWCLLNGQKTVKPPLKPNKKNSNIQLSTTQICNW